MTNIKTASVFFNFSLNICTASLIGAEGMAPSAHKSPTLFVFYCGGIV